MADLVDLSSDNKNESTPSSSSSMIESDGSSHQNIPKSELLRKSVRELISLGVSDEMVAKQNLSHMTPMASVMVEGGTKNVEYKAINKKNPKMIYTCDCKAFKFQKKPIPERSCKHIRAFRGDLAEDLRTAVNAAEAQKAYESLPEKEKEKKIKQREKSREYRAKKRGREKETKKQDEAGAEFEAANEAQFAEEAMEEENKKKGESKTKKGRGGGGNRGRKKAKTDQIDDNQPTSAPSNYQE